MQVTLDLVGILRDYYQVTADFSSGPATFECAPGTSVRDLLEQAGVPDVDDYFIMLDGDRVELEAAANHPLKAGDRVALVAVIKGG